MLYRHWWSTPALLAAIIGFYTTRVCIAEDAAPPVKTAKKTKPAFDPKITIGKETTWITEPVGPSGCIDYLSALNRRGSQGVTPANNAAVELYLATGPFPGNWRQPDEFFRVLGVKVPPKEGVGVYFEDFSKWWLRTGKPLPASGLQGIIDMPGATQFAPWTVKDYPEIAEWLQSIDEPLKHVVNASERTQYYWPVVLAKGAEEKLIDAPLSGAPSSRALAYALTSRAMLHLGNGDQTRAWADLIATHRFGRLVGRGPTSIAGLVGTGIENVAIEAELRFISETHPSAKFVARYVKQLQELPPRSLIMDKFDFGERLTFLDSGVRLSRGEMKLIDILGGGVDDPWARQTIELMLVQSIDWNQVLNTGNQWFDRIVAGGRRATYRERTIAVEQLEKDLEQRKSQFEGFGALSILADKAAQTQVAATLLVFRSLPPVTMHVQSEARSTQRFKHLELAFALAAWHDEHKSYPASLAELAPKYIAAVPQDLFIEQPLHYQKTEDGYRLYSVGENGQDDMGRTYGERAAGDDLTVQMPKPLPEK